MVAEYLVEVGGKHVAVDGPVHAHQRSEAVGGEHGDERPVRAAVQGRGLMRTLSAFGAGVVPAISRVRTRLVHELETGDVLGLQGFEKGRPQGPHPLGVACRGVDPLFFRCQLTACTARPIVAGLTAGPPSAATHTRNSSRVASGCWRRQATKSARLDASRHGAGPPRKGRGASEPLVRWRCNSFSTKETETLNWAATAPIVRPDC